MVSVFRRSVETLRLWLQLREQKGCISQRNHKKRSPNAQRRFLGITPITAKVQAPCRGGLWTSKVEGVGDFTTTSIPAAQAVAHLEFQLPVRHALWDGVPGSRCVVFSTSVLADARQKLRPSEESLLKTFATVSDNCQTLPSSSM